MLLCLTTQVTHASTFKTYTEESNHFRGVMNLESTETLPAKLKDKETGKDAVLYTLEKARIYQVDQKYQESIEAYKKAFELLDKQNNRAVVSVSRMGFKALSMLSNDSVVPYLVAPYEQVLAHISQAKNYIFIHDLQAAGIEMRVAQQLQRDIELNHEKELAKKVEKEKSKNPQKQATDNEEFDSAETPSQLNDALSGLDQIAGKIKNTYQNSYAFYMAANVWEAMGEYNDALVDYKKAYELQPDQQIGQDIQRVDQMGAQHNMATVPVIVFIEQGLVPQKIEQKITLPVPNGLTSIAFAMYDPSTYQTPKPIQVSVDGRVSQRSYVMSDIGALAVKQLKEQTVSTVSSQAARVIAKYAVQQQLGQQLGTLGQLAGNLMNVATEHADLRSWSTLPSNTQIARLNLKPGTYQLKLSQMTGLSSDSVPILIPAGTTQPIFVYAYDINNKISLTSNVIASATNAQ
ncbi:hypothetical protein I2F27_07140 [Acinetobacter sp. B5B]|nr:hypothetical protein [Acinetobacter baretiae]MBF7684248.1 hypothetical protein [Acinetobacter baretiae]